MKKLTWVFLFFSLLIQAQEGKIRGDVFNLENGDPARGLTVRVQGNDVTATTDLDGKFSIDLPVGVYDLVIEDELYEPTDLPAVEVKENEVNYLGEIFVMEKLLGGEEGASVTLKGLTVEARQNNNSETALLTLKKKSVSIMDGISSAKMELTGDATAVDAAKRVTGVSVEGGKYVYIRGLGDRYSKTTLNGMDIPGLDPDKNTIQMDIFPTNLIDNVMVSKNFTADQPADFTGGIMNIETKDFPNKKFTSFSLGVSYNPSMNLISDFLDYKGGKTDFLGFDDGTRALPNGAKTRVVSPDMTKEFNKTLGGSNKSSFLDYSLSFSTGNQIGLKNNNKLGYVFSLTYRNSYDYYGDALFANFQKMVDSNNYDLDREFVREGRYGKNHVTLGALGGISYKTLSSKYRLNVMHLQNGERTAGEFKIASGDQRGIKSDYKGVGYNLEYNQRSLTNALLAGEHVLDNDWEVSWGLSPTLSKSEDPDIRNTVFSLASNGKLSFSPGEGGFPTRTWRYLDEFSGSSKIDVTKKYEWFNQNAKFKAGLSFVYKDRSYEILDYSLSSSSTKVIYWDGDPNQILSDPFLYPNTPYYYIGLQNPDNNPNAYQANSSNMAGYISNEFSVNEKLKAVVGLRVEMFTMHHTGRSVDGASGSKPEQVLNNDKVLSATDLFPSVNLIYALTNNQNLRFSYSRTTARPSFKEMSFAQIYDPLSGRRFSGGLLHLGAWNGDLKQTYINNFDLRWEHFMRGNQLLSLSAFYKQFKDPIELVMASLSNSLEFQPQNVGNSQVFGLEFEVRKSLDFISAELENFNVSTNVTLAKSQLDMSDEEYNARKNNARKGEEVKKTREMAGQAPYIINAGAVYNNPDIAMEVGLFYNVKGPTIYSVGGDGLHPDEYEKPFHNLNFSFSKKIGDNKSLDFKVSNILGDTRERYFESYNSPQGKSFGIYPGRSFSVGFKYQF